MVMVISKTDSTPNENDERSQYHRSSEKRALTATADFQDTQLTARIIIRKFFHRAKLKE